MESVKEVDSEYQLSPDDDVKSKSNLFSRTSSKTDNTSKVKSPTTYFNKSFFSPRSRKRTKSSTSLNVRRFSTDSVLNSQTFKVDRSMLVGRRLSKDAGSFLSSSPPDINSRRSSYLDIISTGSKLSGKSPVLSIENVSECSSLKFNEPLRKLSNSESIGRKLATLPKFREPYDSHKLQPQYSLTLGRSDDTIHESDIDKNQLVSARSNEEIGDNVVTFNGQYKSISKLNSQEKANSSDDEITRESKISVELLQSSLSGKPFFKTLKENAVKSVNMNPQIRIEIEDTSMPSTSKRLIKSRHESIGDGNKSPLNQEASRRGKLVEHSKSLDGHPRRRDRSVSPRCQEHELPPAPPPPNCSPRNSNGKSPLERLTKDELVLLWRSSESELRSHLLKAIRDKEVDDPP